MYVKQISGITDVSEETVKRVIRELYPDKMVKGKATYLNQEEAESVVNKLRMQKQIADSIKVTEHGQNVQVDTQNVHVPTQNVHVDIAVSVAKAIADIMLPIIQELKSQRSVVPVPQIEHKVEYYAVKAYGILKGLKLTDAETAWYGKKATALTKELRETMEFIADSSYGTIGAYKLHVLDQVFVDRLNLEPNPKLF